jgi:predicted Rossmann fold flavoprotein
MPPQNADLAIIGAGAAGLFAGIIAARTYPDHSIVLLDGARKLGAKILVAGGGRCNVTHDIVTADDYAGSSRNAIRKILNRFTVTETIAFFNDIGVELKREEGGKLFPVTDDSKTVLQALLQALNKSNVRIHHICRVTDITHDAHGFNISGQWGEIHASRVILATGGKALPKSGSDGAGYDFAQSLGHTLTANIFPALVPLVLPSNHALCELSGIAVPTTLTVHSHTGKHLISFTDSMLMTHFGISGPCVLDISRHLIAAQQDDPDAYLSVNFLPNTTSEAFDSDLQSTKRETLSNILTDHLPKRLAHTLCDSANLPPSTKAAQLTRKQRQTLVQTVTAQILPIIDHRGYKNAEVTAGGIPLKQLQLKTMESRVCKGLYFCGEICDVDGRIGGYNFQWAWSSGYVAGLSTLRDIIE